ncbi:MAG: hypothetical protein C0599_12240 [Salinivirgaceae bacterium]|nr:MAG: hypothetical protein C0599_12240 [Salinivirgaceae bacterium]
MKKWIVILILVLPTLAQAQISFTEIKSRSYFEVEGLTGSVWAHHDAIKYILQYPPTGVNLKLGFLSNGNNLWQHDLKLPRYGLGYQFATLGSDILGKSHAIYLFVESDIIKKRKWQWYYNLGAGVGFVDNPYDPEKNPLNIVNGSVTNAYLRVSTGASISVNSKNAIGINGGLFHLSNGNLWLPNWGVNAFYGSISWKHKLSDSVSIIPKNKALNSGHKQRVTLYGSMGFKEERPINGENYFISDFHANYWRKHRPAFAWGAGISIIYDEASKKMLWRGDYENEIPLQDFNVKTSDYYSAAIQAGYMLCMHPVYFSFEFGVYVYSTPNRDILNRWLLEIYITHNTRIYGGLKSRFGKADFIEYGLAYDLFRK